MTELRDRTKTDFTGGLNLRASPFNIADNESPDMLNMSVDPRGGFYTRKGWRRWEGAADFAVGDSWAPRSAQAHIHLDDTKSIFVTNDGKIWHSHSGDDGVFAFTGMTCSATPHLADFGSWGDAVYIACGRTSSSVRHDRDDTNIILPAPNGADPGEGVNGPGGWNNDYTNPTGGYAPQAEFCEPHAGYMFYANINENLGGGAQDYPTRIRWSHPGGRPEDFAFNDYIDIDAGGGQITALLSFQDHLLIFKRDSLWALYGYDNTSWQLIKISRHIGAPSSTAVTRSENAAYFFSTSGRNAIFGYTDGNPVEISEKIRPAVEEILVPDNVWLGWANNVLVCNLPWLSASSSIVQASAESPLIGGFGASAVGNFTGTPAIDQTSTFVFDPTIGNGVWELAKMSNGSLGPMVEGTDVIDSLPLAVMYSSDGNHQTVMELGGHAGAYDVLDAVGTEEPFVAVYSTPWMYGDHIDTRKSWRRPRHIVRDVTENVAIRVDGFRDFQESPARSHNLGISLTGGAFWRGTMDSPPWDGVTPPDRPTEVPSSDAGSAHPLGDGFNWDDGTLWESERSGSLLLRTVDTSPVGGGFGKSRSLKLRYVGGAGVRWGIDAIIVKYTERRFTT